jgi:phosphopantetheine adenylyltransferase/dephospho-CoA kinase
MIVIGLTGGIASGKSTAAEQLRELGAVIIDADRLGHRVYEPGTPGFQAVVNEFGHDIVGTDGEINRQVLGGKVFGNQDQMDRLTGIVWPEIRRLAAEEIAEHKRDGVDVVVLEAAVLIEADWIDLVDEVWVVYVKQAVARERLMARNGLSAEQAQSRIDSQISNKERFEHADVRIDNSDSLEQLQKRVENRWKQLQKRVAAPARK